MDKSQVERVKTASDIISVISEYVHLAKRGKNFWGLCPFHSEKTPSFSVDPDKQIYKCFGCGKGGDVFAFVMDKKGLSFAEALSELAAKAGIRLETSRSQPSSEKKALYEANRAAMVFFEQQLASGRGEGARGYLADRGLTGETISAFHLGFAPDTWDSLIKHLKGRGIPVSIAEKCGLLVSKQGGGAYDRFRGRVMFPIIDLSGEVIGFGGRIMGKGEPKYLNTPESPIFEKKRILYNLHAARTTIRQAGAVVVEGYMDVISLANAGFPGAVATLGTALGEDHVRLLRRFTDDITLVFDGDSAGRNAMVRALEPFVAGDVIPRVVILPQGTDPDDIARKGIETWNDLLASAQDIWELIFDESFSRYDPSKLRGQNAILKELVPMIAPLHDSVLRDLLAQRLAVKLGVSPEVVLKGIRPAAAGADQPVSHRTGGERDILETTLARIMLSDRAAVDLIRGRSMSFEFQNKVLEGLFDHLVSHGGDAGDDPGCPDEVRMTMARLMAQGEFPGDPKKALIDTVCRFKSLAIDEELRKIQGELNDAEKYGDKNKRSELQRRKHEMQLMKKNLRAHVMEELEKR
ncbi:MAG TPA: DNA primase [Deltaproteobacteria bacterium]|nr:DNA primase [Deltaproteobacteria bacterium]HPR54045.1 DNA primase [Deltaproteobacteria bacterium]